MIYTLQELLLFFAYFFAGFCGYLLIYRFGSRALFSMLLHVLLTGIYFLYVVTDILPFIPDTKLFEQIIQSGSVPQTQSMGVKLFSQLSYPMRFLSQGLPLVYSQLQIFLVVVATVMIMTDLAEMYKEKEVSTHWLIYLLLLACFPSYLFYSVVPLREFVVLLAIAFSFRGFVYRYLRKATVYWLFYFLLSAFLCISSRPQLIIVVCGMWLLASPRFHSIIFYSIPVGLISITLIELLTPYSVSHSYLEHARNKAINRYSESNFTYGFAQWDSWMDVFMNVPELFLQFVFAPLNILVDVNPMELKLLFLDLLFLLLVSVLSIFGSIQRKPAFRVVILVIGVFMLFSIWEFYLPAIARHRYPVLLLLVPIGVYTLLGKKSIRVYG